MAEEKSEQIIRQTTEELLGKLGIKGTVEIKDLDGQKEINIETEEAGMLIGYHGETLNHLKLILAFLVSHNLGEYQPLTLDISGYRKQREEKIIELAKNIREQVLEEGKPVLVSDLAPWERRLVHIFFSSDSKVTTESQGEGETRQLIIKPR